MKKRSFFERLAGNLRFDDVDEDDVEPVRQELKRPVPVTVESPKEKRELSIRSSHDPKPEKEEVVHEEQEEVGELPVDVYETQGEVIIQTLIAGVTPDNLSINITRDSVVITGRREENRSINDDQYIYRELYWGAFERVIDLPEEVEIDNAEAIERHGMLMIKLPKLDKRRRTTLKIKSI